MGKQDSTARTPRRRVKREENYDQADMCQNLYDALKAAKDSEGKSLVEPFLRVPSRRNDAEYYDKVKDPIDFTRINQRLRAYEYNSFNDFCQDVELVISNAQSYYSKETPEYLNATELQKVYQELKQRGVDPTSPSESAEPSPSPVSAAEKAVPSAAGGPDESKLEHIVALILSFTDKQGRLLSPPFRVLVSREELPDYYEVIEKPIDLKTIALKIRGGEYKTWEAFDEDIQLLINNCKTFNTPNSAISKDAQKINLFYEQKRAEIVSSKLDKAKIAENKRVINGLLEQNQFNENPGLSEDSEEDEETVKNPSILWVLYWAVRNLDKNASGATLADPFLELPNKQHYPDYYDDIQNPMSLYVINKRLKSGHYKSLQDLVDDMLLICYNARCYNLESSGYHKAACKLEKFIAKRARQLDPSIVINIAEVPNEDDDDAEEEDDDGDEEDEEEEEHKPIIRTPKKRAHVSVAESDDNTSERSRPTSHKKRRSEFTEFGSGTIPVRKHPQGRKSIHEHQCIYKNKLLRVFNNVKNHSLNGQTIASPFMYVPDPKTFPDYYKTVKKPIDLATIQKNIDDLSYHNSQEFINDLFLLFSNVRQLYPPNVEIVHHANALQEVAVTTLRQITKGQVIPLPVRKERSSQYRRPSRTPGTPVRIPASALASPIPEAKMQRAAAAAAAAQQQYQRNVAEEQGKMKEVYQAIVTYRGADKRVLADAFIKLPTRDEYPSYYEKIKHPIDLSKILSKLNLNQYESMRHFFADLKLVFDNACTFNDPVSAIYKNALVLQKEVLQLRNQHLDFSVSAEVKLLMMEIFVAVTTYTSNGRCLSESLDDLSKLFKKAGIPDDEQPFSLDEIKYNLDKGRYHRVDRFQEDVFYLFTKIREVAPLDSQLFQDTIDLQKYFIDRREKVCKDTLVTPSKFYSHGELENEIERVKKFRKNGKPEDSTGATTDETTENVRESQTRETETLNNSAESNDEALTSVEFGGITYYPNDYVYVASANDDAPLDAPKHIMRMERIFHDEEGTLVVRGIWCYKPRETFHLATRLFFPNEVFLTPFKDTVTVDRLRGKCCVMFVEEFLWNKPEGVEDADVYVCESRYLGRKQHFKKLTSWPYPEEIESMKVAKRSEALKVTKIRSELAKDGSEADFGEDRKKARSESAQPKEAQREASPGLVSERVKNLPRVLDIHRDEVKDAKNPSDENCTYFEQMQHNGIWYRRGDGVLAFKEQAGHCDVYRIDKMWRTKDDEIFISGPWFARPHEVKHDETDTFFKREVIAVEQPDCTINMNLVQARCAILPIKTFEKSRPTEFPECDVFVVDRRVWGEMPISDPKQCSLAVNTYVRDATIASGLPLNLNDSRPIKNLKKYPQSLEIPEDEIYYFQETLKMDKEPSPLISGTETSLTVDHADLDNESSIITEAAEASADTSAENLPGLAEKGSAKWLESQPKLNAKSKSGYILFSAEIRRRIMSENPDAGFGEVSRIVGVEWKKLNDEQKRQYEVRAQYIAQERAKNDLLTPHSKVLQPGQVRVYLCKWQNCDFQFDSSDGLYEHIKTAHTCQIVDGENQYVCLWQSCLKYRKEGKPFPSLPRLHRHMKEKHLPSSSKAMLPNQRSKHYFIYIAPDESATPHVKGEAPPGHFINHPYGTANPTAPSLTLATPLEDMQTTVTTAPARGYSSNHAPDSTPQRTVKVVNTVYQSQQNGTTQYVQQIPNGSVPVQYVTVGGQPVYQAVVVNHQQGQGQPVHVYHQTPQGTILQTQQVSNQYYQQIPQTSGNSQTIAISNTPHPGQANQTYQTGGPVHVQPTPVHVSYQTPSSHGQTLPPPTPVQSHTQPQIQPAPAVDPRNIITRAPEPIFAPVPDSFTVRRALHTKTYVTYLENLGKQRSISNWNKALTPGGNESITRDKLTLVRKAVKRKVTDDELANSLYLLRDQLMESTCGIKRCSDLRL